MGLAKRRLYKPDRRPARKRGTLDKQAPVSCPNASRTEIAMALYAIAREANVVIGQGGTYDPLKDEYTLVGKILDGGRAPDGTFTGKVQDIKIQGAEVGAAIRIFRRLNGGRAESRADKHRRKIEEAAMTRPQ